MPEKVYSVILQNEVDPHSNGWAKNTETYLKSLGINAKVDAEADTPIIFVPINTEVNPDFLIGVGGIRGVVDTLKEKT